MKLYIETKKLSFDEEENLIKHEIILKISDEKFYGYDILIELPEDDQFIKDTLRTFYKKDSGEIEHKEFAIREENTWNSFPLYEIVSGRIIKFDYNRYQYFMNTDRRIALAFKINELYNPSSEAKILRETLKKVLDNIGMTNEEFEKYNTKVENIIAKNPKSDK